MPGRSTAHHSVAKATNGLFIHWQHVNQSHRLMLEGMIMNNVTQILPRVLYQEGYWQFLQYFTNM
jgi:hypothetical protein